MLGMIVLAPVGATTMRTRQWVLGDLVYTGIVAFVFGAARLRG